MNTSDQPSGMTVGQLSARIRSILAPAVGGEGEAAAMVRDIWEWLTGWDRTKVAVRSADQASRFVADEFERVAARVVAGEPLQYILGQAHFYGMTFDVTPDVLIPRPETAELVDMVIDRSGGRPDLSVLDIATGSGCIAIALARNLPFSRVSATDISERALEVARGNAARLRCKVDFRREDILSAPLPAEPQFDIIVSNPPYIALSEKAQMDSRVVGYEPHSALFVPDSDPLLFYEAICRYAAAALRSGGSLYFEINPLFADRLLHAVESQTDERGNVWSEASLVRDSFGRVRFLSARRF